MWWSLSTNISSYLISLWWAIVNIDIFALTSRSYDVVRGPWNFLTLIVWTRDYTYPGNMAVIWRYFRLTYTYYGLFKVIVVTRMRIYHVSGHFTLSSQFERFENQNSGVQAQGCKANNMNGCNNRNDGKINIKLVKNGSLVDTGFCLFFVYVIDCRRTIHSVSRILSAFST